MLVGRGRAEEAEEAAQEARQLEPREVRFHGLLAWIHVRRKRWQEALTVADEGLALDPEDETCTNLRAMAQTKLGLREEAHRTLEGQLERTPEDATTHANQGWTLLHRGDPREAERHFREALRLDPELEWARAGVVEALKAKSPIYRPVLRYFLWIEGLSTRAQLAFLLGGYAVFRGARALAPEAGALAPLLWCVVGAFFVFVATSWLAAPLANAALLVHPFGRMALSRVEKAQAAVVAGGLALALGLYFTGVLRSDLLEVAGFAVGMAILPLKLAFDLDAPRARWAMGAYAAAVGVVGLACVLLTASAAAIREEIRPFAERETALLERGRAIAAERDGLVERPVDEIQDELGELQRKIEAYERDKSAFDAELEEGGVLSRLETLESRRSARDTAGTACAILAFWVSQLVAGLLARRFGAR